ncbi:thiol-disulfide oxidoreductase DCC family protein [Sedimentitalea arenosa]|uniref:DUF393 domain-containing protein n=1 Tax=Sedimentitalea arenosa TaxID=2798803 RepID=A0A8J7IU01_9RHOB|nr:DUF393 domain-containing protein [Arenibacterium arenosum]MBJ6371337.1 DUF393 domain-containing protein [Arenibacterium arenosum]
MPSETRVLYNAACPVCRAEIDHYARYTEARGLPVRYDDLNSGARADWGIDADTAAKRLHVLKDGQLHSGIDGFLVLWRQMPRYRLLAMLVGLPGLRQLAGLVYDRILAPRLYRRHLRRRSA